MRADGFAWDRGLRALRGDGMSGYLRAIDICCGAGGWAVAARGLPIQIEYVFDLESDCLLTYKENHPHVEPVCCDVIDFDFSRLIGRAVQDKEKIMTEEQLIQEIIDIRSQIEAERLIALHPVRVDADEAARLLGYESAEPLQKLRTSGEGPPFQTQGRRVFYLVDDLREWAKAQPRYANTAQAMAAKKGNNAA